MPNLNHCIECDNPGALSDGLCNNCYNEKVAPINVPVITGDKDTDSLLEDERASQDGEPTTADKYNNNINMKEAADFGPPYSAAQWTTIDEQKSLLYYLKPEKYNTEIDNETAFEVKELVADLEWEMDRMSSSGRETLAVLWKILKIGKREAKDE